MYAAYGKACDETMELLDIIAEKITLDNTGNYECDKCEFLKLSSAMIILHAIREAGFIFIRPNSKVNDGQPAS